MTQFALAVSVALNIALVVGIVLIVRDAFSRLTRSHERTTDYTASLVDRLMANDYASYDDRRFMRETRDESKQPLPPDEPAYEEVAGPDRGGWGSRLGLRAFGPLPHLDEDIEET